MQTERTIRRPPCGSKAEPDDVLHELFDVCEDAGLPVHSISIHRKDHQW